ncbi:MAG TPA: hypothetical protein VGW35_20045 [Methylomirabilota bacterium]|nr:hypothetical protein [Methylomirabilota bacterium]
MYWRAVAPTEKTLGREHPELATTLENYADLLHELKRVDEADVLRARAQAIRAKHARDEAIP